MEEEQGDKDVVIKSTPEGIRRFMEGTIWEDMLRELRIWSDQVGEHYDSCNTIEDLRLIQGRREAIDFCMQLPEMMIKNKEDIMRTQEEKEESQHNVTSDNI